MSISVIVPVLNEADGISGFLSHLQSWRRESALELIVCDGGSSDATAELAAPLCDILLRTAPGRARQMNAGAQQAGRPWLLFLHADTMLGAGAIRALQRLPGDTPRWGRFDVRLGAQGVMYGAIASLMNLRSRLSGIATGDQGIFVHRELFREIDGFPEIPLMEDVALCRLLRRRQRPLCLRQQVVTSARRWQQHGLWRTIFLMWSLRAAYTLGVSPARLHALYYRQERR